MDSYDTKGLPMKKKQNDRSRHQLLTTEGKFIHGRKETEAILEMLHSGWDETTFEGKRLTVHSDYRDDDGRVTTIEVHNGI